MIQIIFATLTASGPLSSALPLSSGKECPPNFRREDDHCIGFVSIPTLPSCPNGAIAVGNKCFKRSVTGLQAKSCPDTEVLADRLAVEPSMITNTYSLSGQCAVLVKYAPKLLCPSGSTPASSGISCDLRITTKPLSSGTLQRFATENECPEAFTYDLESELCTRRSFSGEPIMNCPESTSPKFGGRVCIKELNCRSGANCSPPSFSRNSIPINLNTAEKSSVSLPERSCLKDQILSTDNESCMTVEVMDPRKSCPPGSSPSGLECLAISSSLRGATKCPPGFASDGEACVRDSTVLGKLVCDSNDVATPEGCEELITVPLVASCGRKESDPRGFCFTEIQVDQVINCSEYANAAPDLTTETCRVPMTIITGGCDGDNQQTTQKPPITIPEVGAGSGEMTVPIIPPFTSAGTGAGSGEMTVPTVPPTIVIPTVPPGSDAGSAQSANDVQSISF